MAVEDSNARLAFEIALWRLREQIEYGRSLDSKLGSAFALSAAMIALLGSALIFAAPVEPGGVGAAVILAAGLFIANIVVSTLALLIWRLDIGPSAEQILKMVGGGQELDISIWIAQEISVAERRNASILRIKSGFVTTALVLTAATAIAIATAAILAV